MNGFPQIVGAEMDDIIGQLADQIIGDLGGMEGGRVGQDDDVLGDEYDVLGYHDILGARRRPGGAFTKGRRMLAPGVNRPGERRQWLPLGRVSFTSTSGTTLLLRVNAQRPFRATRLLCAVGRTGASATGLVTVSDLRIGNDPQPALAGEMPVEAFAAESFATEVDLNSSTPGVEYLVNFLISAAPTTTDRVDVSAGMFGFTLQ
jgi:hypothetical protein